MLVPSFLKGVATPGSTGFLILLLVVWLIVRFFWPRRRRLGYAWLLAVTLTYVVLSLPCVANQIADRLMPPQREQAAFSGSLDKLVILDGDNRRGRVREARRVYGIARPREVEVLGETWLVQALRIPLDRIHQQTGPSTTREQMAWVQRSIEPGAAPRTGLIASRLQMPRVAALAKAAGLALVLLPAPADSEPPTHGILLYVPTYTALRVSRDALYEHAALAYYGWRRWIQPT